MVEEDTESPTGGVDAVAWLDRLLLLVDAQVAGRSYDVMIGGRETVLTLPNEGPSWIDLGSDTPRRMPRFPAPPLAPPLTSGTTIRTSVATPVSATLLAVEAVRLRWHDPVFEASVGELGSTTEFSRELGQWLSIVADWLTAWTGSLHGPMQREPTPVVTLAIVGASDRGPIGSGGAVPVVLTGQRAASASEVEAAFDRASRGEHLALERRLFAEAAVYSYRGQNRQAVITACSAAEVALAGSAEAELIAAGGDGDQVTAILKGVTGVVELYRLNATRLFGSAVSMDRVKDQLAGPRNRAVHAGELFDDETASRAVDTARGLLDAVSPLDRSGSQ